MTNAELMDCVLNDDEDAREKLYRLLHRTFFRFFKRGDPNDADDLVHELYQQIEADIKARKIQHPDGLIVYGWRVAEGLLGESLKKKTRLVSINRPKIYMQIAA